MVVINDALKMVFLAVELLFFVGVLLLSILTFLAYREVVGGIQRGATMQMQGRLFSSDNGVIFTCLSWQFSSLFIFIVVFTYYGGIHGILSYSLVTFGIILSLWQHY